MKIEPLGDSALLLRFSGEEQSERPARLRQIAEIIERANLPGVIETTSAPASVAIFFDPDRVDAAALSENLPELIASADARAEAAARLIEIPVCFGEEFALDRARVSAHTALSADVLVTQFCATEFIVTCIGFMPGFPYLSGLPRELRVPRLETPRTKVPAGSVAIAGDQAGIYPFHSPGGWNILGRTPLSLFNPDANPPALFRPGDRVRFRPIAREEFDR